MISSHEQILIEGLKEGNTKIFDYIFDYYYSGMVVFAMKYTGNIETAEDIVQDFFVKLWLKRTTLGITSTLKNYFFTSIKNRCIDFLRKENIKDKSKNNLINELQTISNPRNLLIESELREQINAAIDKLPPACKEIFILNRFEGLKPLQIAEKRGISVRTVETQIGKALKILRKELETYLPSAILALLLRTF